MSLFKYECIKCQQSWIIWIVIFSPYYFLTVFQLLRAFQLLIACFLDWDLCLFNYVLKKLNSNSGLVTYNFLPFFPWVQGGGKQWKITAKLQRSLLQRGHLSCAIDASGSCPQCTRSQCAFALACLIRSLLQESQLIATTIVVIKLSILW